MGKCFCVQHRNPINQINQTILLGCKFKYLVLLYFEDFPSFPICTVRDLANGYGCEELLKKNPA